MTVFLITLLVGAHFAMLGHVVGRLNGKNMNGRHEHEDKMARAIESLADSICRVACAIEKRDNVSDSDRRLLDNLLKRSEHIAKKLERLDAITPSKPR